MAVGLLCRLFIAVLGPLFVMPLAENDGLVRRRQRDNLAGLRALPGCSVSLACTHNAWVALHDRLQVLRTHHPFLCIASVQKSRRKKKEKNASRMFDQTCYAPLTCEHPHLCDSSVVLASVRPVPFHHAWHQCIAQRPARVRRCLGLVLERASLS